MDNNLIKQLIDKIDTILLEKADCVVIHFNQKNVKEAELLKNLLEKSPLFKKYASRKIGVIMIPDTLKLEVVKEELL